MNDTSPTVPIKCLNCEKELGSPIVCTGCKTLFPPPRSADFFDLLGLPHQYTIDETQLNAAFRALTRNIHPDRFTDQPGEMRSLSTQLSAEINQAYVILKDPVQRAAYMLESAGGPSAAELREVPGNLLAEIMMIREQVEAAQSAGDEQMMSDVRSSVDARRAVFLSQIAGRAEQLSSCTDAEKTELRRWLNAIKYLDSLLDELAADPLAIQAK
jgi:molecular chaperone HscB